MFREMRSLFKSEFEAEFEANRFSERTSVNNAKRKSE